MRFFLRRLYYGILHPERVVLLPTLQDLSAGSVIYNHFGHRMEHLGGGDFLLD